MKKILLASLAVICFAQMAVCQDVPVDTQDVPVITKVYPDGLREVSVIGPDGDKLLSFMEMANGSFVLSGYNGHIVQETNHQEPVPANQDISENHFQTMEKSYQVIGDNYKKTWHFKNKDLEFVLQETQSGNVLYKMLGTDEYIYVYDGKGSLIAEGPFNQVSVHNEQAFNELKSIMVEGK